MGRWVTSKGRRIYIPDEGEENPFAKNKTGVTRKDKDGDKLKNQINKDFDLKEKQIADNAKQKEQANGKINNDYKSQYGLKNVGELKSFTGIGGSTVTGTVEPTVENVQEYFNTGSFRNYGTNARAKKDIAKKIADDMLRRGYDIQVSEDGTKLYPAGETGKTISFGQNKDGEWVAKTSKSAGVKERTGMKKALDAVGKTQSLSKMNTNELRELAVSLGADKKRLYGTSKSETIVIINSLRKKNNG